MKFEVELRKEAYLVLPVEADNPDEAEAKALAQVPPHEIDFWTVESVEDLT